MDPGTLHEVRQSDAISEIVTNPPCVVLPPVTAPATREHSSSLNLAYVARVSSASRADFRPCLGIGLVLALSFGGGDGWLLCSKGEHGEPVLGIRRGEPEPEGLEGMEMRVRKWGNKQLVHHYTSMLCYLSSCQPCSDYGSRRCVTP